MLWELRYRAPRQVDDVLIETIQTVPGGIKGDDAIADTPAYREAKALADAYLSTLASPAIRFVRLRPMVVARTVDYPAVADLVRQPAKVEAADNADAAPAKARRTA